jgi:hypothetical protein
MAPADNPREIRWELREMSDVYVIEVAGRTVGLVARAEDGRSYRFHAAIARAFGLDGRVFRTPDEAQEAARKALDVKTSIPFPDFENAA